MKNLFLAMACAGVFASASQAGTLDEPLIEEEVIIEETVAGSSGNAATVVALMGILLIATAVSN